MLLNESETLYDSDADPDFVPAKRGKDRAIDDSGDDGIYILKEYPIIFLKNKNARMVRQE